MTVLWLTTAIHVGFFVVGFVIGASLGYRQGWRAGRDAIWGKRRRKRP